MSTTPLSTPHSRPHDSTDKISKAWSGAAVMQPLDLAQVTVKGEFGRRIERIIEANILQVDVEKIFLDELCKRRKVDVGWGGRYIGVGKFIDAVVRLAYTTRDERLRTLKKGMVEKLVAAQDADGYIGIFQDPKQRVQTLWDVHEGAYLIWAFVSDYLFFRERASLEAARRLGDFFIARLIASPGLRIDQPLDLTFEVGSIGWHRALLALSEATGDSRYRDHVVQVLKLAQFNPPIKCGTTTFANHTYTHLSICLAQLDLYRQTGDSNLLRTTRRAIEFLRHGDGMVVTGTCSRWECWHDTQSGGDNLGETCAGVYLALLMDAMLQIEGESLYGDILERDIYNALFAATDPDGSKSRYFTSFEGARSYEPQGACCLNNNKRFLADLRSWIYYRTAQGIAVNLYNASSAAVDIASDVTLRIEQQTDYPSSGKVLIKIDPSKQAHFEVKLRIPRWCRNATVLINGAESAAVSGGQFYGITRGWRAGDVIELDMPMPWRFIKGRRSQEGRAAILRGPVIFTFNPERNRELSAKPGFDLQQLKINPLEIESPQRDDAVRPEGISCRIKAWSPAVQPWLKNQRAPMVLSEYPDPGGQGIYFTVPGEGISLLTDDELCL